MNSNLLNTIAAWIDEADGMGFLAAFLIKATLILGAGLFIHTGFKKWGAAQRFRNLWMVTLAVPLCLITVWVNALPDTPDAPEGYSMGLPGDLPEITLQWEKPSATGPVLPAPSTPDVLESHRLSAVAAQQWQPLTVLVWLMGMAVVWLRMIWSRVRLAYHSQGWQSLEEGKLFDQLRVISAENSLSKIPRLFVSGKWVMPSTWGWLRPAIVLPLEAEEWSADRLHFVLHHEVGHIVRKDALFHLLAQLSLSLVWFHPLGWLVQRRLSALRESAYDDLVVGKRSVHPLGYVTELFALVKHHQQHTPYVHPIGFATAQSSEVGKRVRRLLAEGVNRRPTPRGRKVGAALVWIAALMGLSGMVSCRTTPVSATQKPVKPAPVKPGVSKTATYSPLEARPGAKKIHFAIMEITVDETRGSFWSAYLAPGVPRVVAFDSLRIAADKKGVDLMTLPDVFEGQQMNYKVLREFPFATEFTLEGDPITWDSKSTGLRVIVEGETTRQNTIIAVELDFSITEFEGFTSTVLGNGKIVSSPNFQYRKFSARKIQIPNGGFVILNDPALVRSDTQESEDRS